MNKPLCVDCDGTLIASDLLYEAFFLMLKQYPLGLFLLPFWLMKGKVYLKERLAERVTFNWELLPYRPEVLGLIKRAREQGRQVVLVTASPMQWASGLAKYLGCFDQVLASEKRVNLAGKNKADYLVRLFGERGFDYAGDSRVDLHVWEYAASAIVVSADNSLLNRVSEKVNDVQMIKTPRAKFLVYLRALRVHQWLKNLLIVVPLLAAHKLNVFEGFVQVFYAFLAFSLCASAVYVLNDLLDLDSDRQHIRKCKRPFAAGSIPLWQGMLMVPLLLGIAFSVSMLLPGRFILVLGIAFSVSMLLPGRFILVFTFNVLLKL